MIKISGIYQIINIINKKMYIGSAKNIKDRWRNHKRLLNNDKHSNRYLQRAWNKYGKENFDFQIIESIDSLINLIPREQHFIDNMMSYNKKYGYNLSPTAGSTLGVKYSEEAKLKIGLTHKGKIISIKQRMEHSKFMSGSLNPFYGKKHSKKTRKKMSENHANFNGENSGCSKLTNKDVVKIRLLYKTGKYTYKDLSDLFPVNDRSISNILNYKTWKYI